MHEYLTTFQLGTTFPVAVEVTEDLHDLFKVPMRKEARRRAAKEETARKSRMILSPFLCFFSSSVVRSSLFAKIALNSRTQIVQSEREKETLPKPWVQDDTSLSDSGDACGFLLSKYFIPNRDVNCAE